MSEEKSAKNKSADQELADIAVELLKILKPKGLKIWQVRRVIEHMAKAVEHITYGPQ